MKVFKTSRKASEDIQTIFNVQRRCIRYCHVFYNQFGNVRSTLQKKVVMLRIERVLHSMSSSRTFISTQHSVDYVYTSGLVVVRQFFDLNNFDSHLVHLSASETVTYDYHHILNWNSNNRNGFPASHTFSMMIFSLLGAGAFVFEHGKIASPFLLSFNLNE